MSIPAPSRLPGSNLPGTRAVLTVAVSVFFTLTTSRLAESRDILRGSATGTPAAAGGVSSPALAASQQAALNAARAQDTLRRTTQAMQAVAAFQNAARAAARTGPNNLGLNPNTGLQLPNVTDGLVAEGSALRGLKVAQGVTADLQKPADSKTLWIGANAPSQTVTNGQTNVTITQTKQQALLNWETFDIGTNTTLTFDQSAGGSSVGNWIAFNKVNDPTGIPSQILGSIKATGQVYIINQNGIIFGGSSQVNTHALVASSIPINTNLLSAGLMSNSEKQFLFSSEDIPKFENGIMEAFIAPSAPNTPTGKPGPVQVQAGAIIECPTSSDHSGGRVMLVGSSVTNAGTISTPDGQTILAAGTQLGIEESGDTTKRGLNIYIGNGAGDAINTGLISSERGNITIAGKTVDQSGYLYSTTSVSYNGRIDLIADYATIRFRNSLTGDVSLYPTASGKVNLGAGSVTEIVPETWSSETLTATSLTLNSTVNIKGLAIYFSPESVLHAPSAEVSISAGTWYSIGDVYYFGNAAGCVYLDSGAVIDVAGAQDVEIPVARNVVSVELRGTELADSPVQRNSPLAGKTVKVDARYGTPLANADGWFGLIGHTVGELTTTGGKITISAGDSVVMQNGSRIDVSGGWINYTGGEIQTTRLLSGGHIYDISNASADLVYDGIYSGFTVTHSKWNVSRTYTNKLLSGVRYEEGYIEGSDSGSIEITAPGMALDGQLYGNTVIGPRQRTETPASGSLALKFEKTDLSKGSAIAVLPAPVKITFQSGITQQAVEPFDWEESFAALRSDRATNVILSPDLVNVNGFGTLTINNSNDNYGSTSGNKAGWITVASGVDLSPSVGGSLTFIAPNIDIQGSIIIGGGVINLTALDISTSHKTAVTSDPQYNAERGNIILGSNAKLSTAGLMVDDRVTSASHDSAPLMADGGSITIVGNDANLQGGSVLDVSGGLLIGANGKISYGSGGSLTIQTGQDPNFGATLGGKLHFESDILGYGGLKTVSFPSTLSNGQSLLGANLKFAVAGTGGELTIQAPMVQVGGADPGGETFYVSEDFFNQGGFTTFNFSGIGSEAQPGLSIEPGTTIQPVAKTRIFSLATGLADHIEILPEAVRQPLNLSFTALGASDKMAGLLLFLGNLVVGEGAVIEAGSLANVSFDGDTVAMLGSVLAPGGEITITGAKSYPSNRDLSYALPTVYLGPNSLISAAGKTLLVPDSRGYRGGVVLDGGSIAVDGNIVAAPGSMLDVSGTSSTLDLPLAYSGKKSRENVPTRLTVAATRVESDGGAITLTGRQELFSAATLVGRAGGSSAEGGSVKVSSGRFYADKTSDTTDINLTVTQNDTILSSTYLDLGAALLGKRVVDSEGRAIAEQGYFAIDSLANGGFSSVTLGGNVEFLGDVTIGGGDSQISTLNIAKGGVLFADGNVTLNAVYVTLGQAFTTPMQATEAASKFIFSKRTLSSGEQEAFIEPSYGTGVLTVNATYIDIGNLSLQNIGNAYLNADNGDIRGNGSLDIAGHITLRAGQIYPPTGVSFTLAAYDYMAGGVLQLGSVTIESSGVRQTPLSAGGSLYIYGSIINQSGVVRAPFGTITLGCVDASTASVGAMSNKSMATTKQLTLGAGSVTSVSAYDPVTKTFLTIPYGLNTDGSQWFDPKGIDISTSGLPAKHIDIAGANVALEFGAQIDMRGGGDLMAYTAVSGTGGTVDILSSTSKSFAVLPSYQSGMAPYAPFNNSANAVKNLKDSSGNADPGYVSTSLKVGDSVYLEGCDGLAAGYYTLLPARYALLSGAVLVTPVSGSSSGAKVTKTDGAYLVSGYTTNNLNSSSGQQVYQRFEVATSPVFSARYEYDTFLANAFLKEAAAKSGKTPQRLPMDSGHLVFQATQSMLLDGSILSKPVSGGRGGMIDISSPVDIVIAGNNTTVQEGVLTLSSSDLSAIGAESLLIGGVRDELGTTVYVQTDNLTVDNSGSPLAGSDIVLVSSETLTVAPDSVIEQKGEVADSLGTLSIYRMTELASPGDSIVVSQAGVPITFTQGTAGNNKIISSSSGAITNADGTTVNFEANTAVSVEAGASLVLLNEGTVKFAPGGTGGAILIAVSDGLLLRVSGDETAGIARPNMTTLGDARLTIGMGAKLSGKNLILDSTYATNLSSQADLSGQMIALNSGQISIDFGSSVPKQASAGLVLSGNALDQLFASAKSLALLSYSSIDIYGSGVIGNEDFEKLTLHAADIRGYDSANATFIADTIVLDNNTQSKKPAASSSALAGSLTLQAGTLFLGNNTVNVELYENVTLKASRAIVATGTGGFITAGGLTLAAPIITGETGANQTIIADGALKVESVGGEQDKSLVTSLGAMLTLQGASVDINSDIILPSGVLKVQAKSGDISIGNTSAALIDVGGLEQVFVDMIKYTSGGDISFIADTGSVKIGNGGRVILDGKGGTDAGGLTISTINGGFDLAGTMSAIGGDGGRFSLDVRSLTSTSALDAILNSASFFSSRSYRVRTGDVTVDGSVAAGTFARAKSYNISTDVGNIDVTGVIDASGEEGGSISLQAHGDLTLKAGSLLNVIGDDFSSSGAGGSVTLEAGCAALGSNGAVSANLNALLDIQAGSTIELGVLSNTNVAANAAHGLMNGTLHLRAPITANGLDVRVNSIDGAVKNASSIEVEGYKVFTTGTSGNIDSTLRGQVLASGSTFLGASGVTTASYTTMLNRLRGSNGYLYGTNTGLDSVFSIQFGAEIVNPKGDIVLGGSNVAGTASNGDWNLATYRFGPSKTAGVLTMRAAGNLVFYNALSDGFASSSYTAALLAQNTALPVNSQSWGYRLTAGADFNAADFHQVIALDHLAPNSGSLLLGKDGGQAKVSGGETATTSTLLSSSSKTGLYQVIRTGSGDIDISLGRNLQLLNQFATIYTAGTKVVDATRLFVDASSEADFVVPIVDPPKNNPSQPDLGVVQQDYLAQYSMAGGDITIKAQWDMLHQTLISGVLKADSERQLPINWLYRRGIVDVSGVFASITVGNSLNKFTDTSASTTWWVDFSNFFEGIAALGGGNVTLIAGHDISNIDAAIPTNARMPKGTPNSSKLVELGGGDLTVKAGHDIDAGVYYVERGQGTLTAGNTIHTNSTRSPSLTTLASVQYPVYENELTWLPTTLFVGKGGFDVSAKGDVLLGPVANLFWLPQGLQNKFWYKTYFNTYSPNSYVNVSSLAGDVTLREKIVTSDKSAAIPILQAWMENELLLTGDSASNYQPWLRLTETNVTQFSTVFSVMTPIFSATSFSGDINIAGDLTLYPSSAGTIDLLADGSINGLQKVGYSTDYSGNNVPVWHASAINLSDADPASLSSPSSPLTSSAINYLSDFTVMKDLTTALEESASILASDGSLSTKQARHASYLLHLYDSNPIRFYAQTGNISGLTLFSGKYASLIAGEDITDIGLYVQNLRSSDTTVISAGRDILLYYPKSPLHSQATADGNIIDVGGVLPSGDVQIGGPGVVEILAGRNVDLGTGQTTNAASDTNLGIVTVGNARNPYLASVGADVIVAAGLGSSLGLDALDFDSFITKFLDPSQSSAYASTYLQEIMPQLSVYLPENGLSGGSDEEIWSAFESLSPARQRTLALDVFFLALRDAGRNSTDASSFGYNYQSGYDAIAALFPGDNWEGDILLTSREIKTKAGVSTSVASNPAVSGTDIATLYIGGNITTLAPGGEVKVGLKLQGGQDQGILTEHGGNITMFSEGSVSVGLSRIFTLRGGDLIIWSTAGNIAAGASSKTIQSAPPTRVVNDPQSANTQVDFGGLYTGGGIGVLASVEGVPEGQVDLIAPGGNIDAGDAGIRSTGDLHVAALQVLNASNIQVSGVSTGTPAAPSAPNVSGNIGTNPAAAATNAAVNTANEANNNQAAQSIQEMPSLITVEVIGYGGGDDESAHAQEQDKEQKP